MDEEIFEEFTECWSCGSTDIIYDCAEGSTCNGCGCDLDDMEWFA